MGRKQAEELGCRVSRYLDYVMHLIHKYECYCNAGESLLRQHNVKSKHQE